MRNSSLLCTNKRNIDTGMQTPATIYDQIIVNCSKTKRLIINSVPMQKRLNAKNMRPGKPIPLNGLKRERNKTISVNIRIRVKIGSASLKNHTDLVACSIRYRYRPVLKYAIMNIKYKFFLPNR